jgi:hypothetical protein
MITLSALAITLLAGTQVAPSTGTGCRFNDFGVPHTQALLGTPALAPKMSKRCRRVRDVQRWVATLRS